MLRTILIAVFSTSILAFLCLGVWFYVKGDTMIAAVMIGMVPAEAVSWYVVDKAISRQKG